MTATMTTVACPVCGGEMYDNRETKKNPKQPDFKCKRYKEGCEGVIWPAKGGRPAPKPAAPAYVPNVAPLLPNENGAEPYFETGAPPVEAPYLGAPPAISKLADSRAIHAKCFREVLEHYVPTAAKHGVELSLEGVSALTFQLYKMNLESR